MTLQSATMDGAVESGNDNILDCVERREFQIG
jgi:hypothetical protein